MWSFESPSIVSVTPRGRKAPKLWPAEPTNFRLIVSSGRPLAPYRLVISAPRIVPTTRLTLWMGIVDLDLGRALERRLAEVQEHARSRDSSRLWSWAFRQYLPHS